jgi:hypothetical protein
MALLNEMKKGENAILPSSNVISENTTLPFQLLHLALDVQLLNEMKKRETWMCNLNSIIPKLHLGMGITTANMM